MTNRVKPYSNSLIKNKNYNFYDFSIREDGSNENEQRHKNTLCDSIFQNSKSCIDVRSNYEQELNTSISTEFLKMNEDHHLAGFPKSLNPVLNIPAAAQFVQKNELDNADVFETVAIASLTSNEPELDWDPSFNKLNSSENYVSPNTVDSIKRLPTHLNISKCSRLNKNEAETKFRNETIFGNSNMSSNLEQQSLWDNTNIIKYKDGGFPIIAEALQSVVANNISNETDSNIDLSINKLKPYTNSLIKNKGRNEGRNFSSSNSLLKEKSNSEIKNEVGLIFFMFHIGCPMHLNAREIN